MVKEMILKWLRKRAEKTTRVKEFPYDVSRFDKIQAKRNGKWFTIKRVNLPYYQSKEIAENLQLEYYIQKLGRFGRWLKK